MKTVHTFAVTTFALFAVMTAGCTVQNGPQESATKSTQALTDVKTLKGDWSGSLVPNADFSGAHCTVSGNATHLGLYTYVDTLGFGPDPANPGKFAALGDATWTAADGSVLTTTVIERTPADGGPTHAEHTITGGTGRFEGATGWITLDIVVTGPCPCGGLQIAATSFAGEIIGLP